MPPSQDVHIFLRLSSTYYFIGTEAPPEDNNTHRESLVTRSLIWESTTVSPQIFCSSRESTPTNHFFQLSIMQMASILSFIHSPMGILKRGDFLFYLLLEGIFFLNKKRIKSLGIHLPKEVNVLRKLYIRCWWKKLKTTQTDGKITILLD